jgi:hypothetical protein
MAKPAPIDISVSTVIAAVDPATVYDLISNVTDMPRFSPETTEVSWVGSSGAATVGARFKGTNRLGSLKWSTKPTITEAQRGQVFSFKVPGKAGALWTYKFEAIDGGTRVTESVHQSHPSPLPIRLLQRRAGVTDRADNLRSAMQVTLDRLTMVALAA